MMSDRSEAARLTMQHQWFDVHLLVPVQGWNTPLCIVKVLPGYCHDMNIVAAQTTSCCA